uniref:Innexin n=1 Tax=Panagrolaimus sp. ES5 TaxID=591445 RepID=A0AC34FIV9_9BILA
MFRILQKIYNYARAKHDDDCIARLNYSFTPKILFLLIIFIALKQFAGHPIQCWVSADLLIHWEGYIEKYCFVEGTYFVNQSEPMMPAKDAREDLKIKYYKWIPVFLCVQLVLFLAVKKFWSFSSESSGLDIYSIFGTCPLAPEAPKDNIKLVRIYVQRYQKILKYESKRIEKIWGCLSTTSYLTYLFLIYKVLALVNVGFQLWWMNHYFNTEYPLWGIGVLQNLYNKKDWIASGVFPRITFCDFIRRDETNSGPMSFPVQCVLVSYF